MTRSSQTLATSLPALGGISKPSTRAPTRAAPRSTITIDVPGNSAQQKQAEFDLAKKQRRQLRLDERAHVFDALWIHPDGALQEESMTFHRIRALMETTGFTAAFISSHIQVDEVSILSYLDCRYRLKLNQLEYELEKFIAAYIDGKYDEFMQESPDDIEQSNYAILASPSVSVPLPAAALVAAASANTGIHVPHSDTLQPALVQPAAIVDTNVATAPDSAVQGHPNRWSAVSCDYSQKNVTRDNYRKQILDRVAGRLSVGWNERQSATFHRLRAFLEITSLPIYFVASKTNLPQQALELYLRCEVRGRQTYLENQIEVLLQDFIRGEYVRDASMVIASKKYPYSSQVFEYGTGTGTGGPQQPPHNVQPTTTAITTYNNHNNSIPHPEHEHEHSSTLTATSPRGNPLLPPQDSSAVDRRKQLLEDTVVLLRSSWVHPTGPNVIVQTLTFHRTRALMEMLSIPTEFVCLETSITLTDLSGYLQCASNGRQRKIEEKLVGFIDAYLAGKYEDTRKKVNDVNGYLLTVSLGQQYRLGNRYS